MTDREMLYTGVSRAAWGYFFLYFNVSLGNVNFLPAFVGYLLFLSAIHLLKEERRDLALLRPLGILLALWQGADWLVSLGGISLEGRLPVLELLVSLAGLYFHFQLFTDFASLAAKYQNPGEDLDRRLLKRRTLQTLLLTAMTLLSYPVGSADDWRIYGVLALGAAGLILGILLMASLFALRGIFREDAETAEKGLG